VTRRQQDWRVERDSDLNFFPGGGPLTAGCLVRYFVDAAGSPCRTNSFFKDSASIPKPCFTSISSCPVLFFGTANCPIFRMSDRPKNHRKPFFGLRKTPEKVPEKAFSVFLRARKNLTEGCEACSEDAELPFDNILDRLTGSDPSMTDYVLEMPAPVFAVWRGDYRKNASGMERFGMIASVASEKHWHCSCSPLAVEPDRQGGRR
jgi:hypothetical protein